MSTAVFIKNIFRTFNALSVFKIAYNDEVAAGGHLCQRFTGGPLLTFNNRTLTIAGILVTHDCDTIKYNGRSFHNPEHAMLRAAFGHFFHVMADVKCTSAEAVLCMLLMRDIITECSNKLAGGDHDLFVDTATVEKIAALEAKNAELAAQLAAAQLQCRVHFGGPNIHVRVSYGAAKIVRFSIKGTCFPKQVWAELAKCTDTATSYDMKTTIAFGDANLSVRVDNVFVTIPVERIRDQWARAVEQLCGTM